MSVVYHIPQAYVNSPVRTFKPSSEQAAAIRRYGIRVTPLEGTERLVSRPCKCGHVQEYTIDTEDTERNRWEARAAIDRLSGDDWRCTFCAMPSLITYRAKNGGAGASGAGNGSKGGKVTRRKQAGQRSNPRTSYAQQMAAAHGWTLVKVGNRYYMTKDGEQARSFSNLDQVLDFVQQQAKAVA